MTVQMSKFADTIVKQKYSHDKEEGGKESWEDIAFRVSKHVLRAVHAPMPQIVATRRVIEERKFIPGGRYLYAAGNEYHQVQNCLLLKAEDSREGWADLMHKSTMALMTGAGIGIDYSSIRPEGKAVRKTGGIATGPLALMQMVNEAGRGIMQGGARRCSCAPASHCSTPGASATACSRSTPVTPSASPSERARALILKVAQVTARLPNGLAIAGHTDSSPFRGEGRSNWDLSADRANAVRRLLVENGVNPARLRSVSGYAEREPLLPADPGNAGNRRVAITLLRMAPAAAGEAQP
jgi:hypothetical protein